MVGSALTGCVFGAALAGKFTDAMGRRTVLAVSGLLFLLSGLWCYFAPTVSQLVAARILGGIAVGRLASLLVPVYIAEIAPPRYRGALVSLNQVAILLGMVISYLANAHIGRVGDAAWLNTTGWRIMLGARHFQRWPSSY